MNHSLLLAHSKVTQDVATKAGMELALGHVFARTMASETPLAGPMGMRGLAAGCGACVPGDGWSPGSYVHGFSVHSLGTSDV